MCLTMLRTTKQFEVGKNILYDRNYKGELWQVEQTWAVLGSHDPPIPVSLFHTCLMSSAVWMSAALSSHTLHFDEGLTEFKGTAGTLRYQ